MILISQAYRQGDSSHFFWEVPACACVKFFFEIDKLNDEDLTIIILADHSYNYTSSYESNLFNLIIRHKKSINLNSNLDGFFDHYDLFPIILEETLFNVADGKAALGSFNTKNNKNTKTIKKPKNTKTQQQQKSPAAL